MFSHAPSTGPHGPGFFKKALEQAKEAVREGGILRYEVQQCPLRGRIIRMANRNGWSPYPMFVEFPR